MATHLGIVPRAEVVKLALDFLRPPLGGMGKQGELGIGLGGLALAEGFGKLAYLASPPKRRGKVVSLTPDRYPRAGVVFVKIG